MIKNLVYNLKKSYKSNNVQLHTPAFFGNEIKYLKECITSGYVSYVGNFVKIFEKKLVILTKSKYVIATSSGTSALHLILNYLNVNENDEVLMPSFTYVATANAVKYCNASPNFIDIETETLGVCPKKLDLYLKKISFKKNKKTSNSISRCKNIQSVTGQLY